MKRFLFFLPCLFVSLALFGAPGDKDSPERQELQQKAKARIAEDDKHYNRQERLEIRELYTSWREKKGDAQKAVAQTLLRKYPKSNWAGCMLINQANVSPRQEEMRYLRQAIANYSDCYFASGVQVGALARYLMGKALLRDKRKGEARHIFNELRTLYPEARAVTGALFVDLIPKD